jgi:thiol:disulfide interchange protein
MKLSHNHLLALAFLGLLAFVGCSSNQDAASTTQATLSTHSPTTAANEIHPGIQFLDNYQEGIQLARQTGKPALLFFTAAWCTFCHEMEQNAFADSAVIQLSEEFVCIIVDADAHPDVCKGFGVQMFPTVQFVSPEGVAMNRIVGGSSAEQILPQMEAALRAAVARRDIPTGPILR